ncbi:MAG: hypothetical protein EHM21_13685 [Chloroflexi bacterium]|nr:MAG: hypothetical protein EHM21_13685 [Chloroflexota bacterium]
MQTIERYETAGSVLAAPERNNYFYGMLMDVYHFKRETAYFNRMRRMINRMVLGYGVVCGLDVQPGPKENQVIVTPGMALDQLGNEIIISHPVGPLTIPEDVIQKATGQDLVERYRQKPVDPDLSGCVQVLLCYQECLVDPVPALAGDCASADGCLPGTVREQFKIKFVPGCSDHPDHDCRLQGVIGKRHITHDVIAQWVTYNCPTTPNDPCIPLANVIVDQDQGHHCEPDMIDITVRPVVYNLDLIYEILLGLAEDRPQNYGRSK